MTPDPNESLMPINVPEGKEQILALVDKTAEGLSRLYYKGQIVKYVGPVDSEQSDMSELQTKETNDERVYLLRGSVSDVKDLKERIKALLLDTPESRNISPIKALSDIQVHPLELRINGHRDSYYWCSGKEFWTMTTLECIPDPASNYWPVGLEYGLKYIRRQIDEFEQRVGAVRNEPEAAIDILGKHKDDILPSDPFQFSEDQKLRDVQLRAMGCIWARKAFRYKEIYNILKSAPTPLDRFRVLETYSVPQTGFFAVLPRAVCPMEQIHPPYIFNIKNFGAYPKSESEIADEIEGIYPKLFSEWRGDKPYLCYLAFAVPEFALDLVNECFEIQRRPAIPNKMISVNPDKTANVETDRLLPGK